MYAPRHFTFSLVAIATVAFSTWILNDALFAQSFQNKIARETTADFNAEVDMVMLSFTVQDARGRYVDGLKPSDLKISEDGIAQKISTFSAGASGPLATVKLPGSEPAPGANVFLLFDTSNTMYKGFTYAEDAVADFIRSMDKKDAVAVYTFSRNLCRAAKLTHEGSIAIQGLRTAVAGDGTALYNALLLTLRDAAKVSGRREIIVFSNGPDDSSVIRPDDVAALAQDEGIPIYVIATNDMNRDMNSSVSLRRLADCTGGKAFWARSWQKQREAFNYIQEGLRNSYTVAYYPSPNPNRGFRKITVEVPGDAAKKLRVRARPGYRPRESSAGAGFGVSESLSESR